MAVRSLRIRPSASAPLATLSLMAPPRCCTTSDLGSVLGGLGWSVWWSAVVHVVARFQTYCSLTMFDRCLIFVFILFEFFSYRVSQVFSSTGLCFRHLCFTRLRDWSPANSRPGFEALRYVRIDYPTDTVPGSWQQSSRNSKLQGVVPWAWWYRWWVSAKVFPSDVSAAPSNYSDVVIIQWYVIYIIYII